MSSNGFNRNKQSLLILDVDGTIYENFCDIESQIKVNAQAFGRKYNISNEKYNEYHSIYGSLIRGLCIEKNATDKDVVDYYHEVYSNIDMSKLRCYNIKSNELTGYSESFISPFTILSNIPTRYIVASNSPFFHVKRVFNRLGISNLPIERYITPDLINYKTKAESEYWMEIIKSYPLDQYDLCLIDDNIGNVTIARSLGISTIHINEHVTLLDAILKYLHIYPIDFEFNEKLYLQSKNVIDTKSYNKKILDELSTQLTNRIINKSLSQSSKKTDINVIDIGSGLLNILDAVIEISNNIKCENATIRLNYLAYESNYIIWLDSCKLLESYDYQSIDNKIDSQINNNIKSYTYTDRSVDVLITVVCDSFMTNRAISYIKSYYNNSIDLIIGCCIVDLFDPIELVTQLTEIASDSNCYIYLPISFCGYTYLDSLVNKSDSKIVNQIDLFSIYHLSLKNLGHHIDSNNLLNVFKRFNCQLVPSNINNNEYVYNYPSIWSIDYKNNKYLFNCLLRFFARGIYTNVSKVKSSVDVRDVIDWFQNLYNQLDSNEDLRLNIYNTDILLQCPFVNQQVDNLIDIPVDTLRSTNLSTIQKAYYLQFVKPRTLDLVNEQLDMMNISSSVLVKGEYSLISSGTELKIYRGDFDSNELLDSTIDGMKDEILKFPLRYGYSYVGHIIKISDDLTNIKKYQINDRVFCFSSHSDYNIISNSNVHVIPNDITSLDAIFFPSIETAISLVMAANLLPGESIAIVGQGLIGILVTAVVQLTYQNIDITIIDVNQNRLDISNEFNKNNRNNNNLSIYNPLTNELINKRFDKVIEISGNSKGLQLAIDRTINNGTVVIGSLYSEEIISLQLGLRFHRSGIKLITSQVSTIPSQLSGTWNKTRRFDYSWHMTRKILPSKLFVIIQSHRQSEVPIRSFVLEEIKLAYNLLDQGKCTVTAIKY